MAAFGRKGAGGDVEAVAVGEGEDQPLGAVRHQLRGFQVDTVERAEQPGQQVGHPEQQQRFDQAPLGVPVGGEQVQVIEEDGSADVAPQLARAKQRKIAGGFELCGKPAFPVHRRVFATGLRKIASPSLGLEQQ